MGDDRKIRFQGKELGSHSVRDLYLMATRGKIDYKAEFWSERELAWRPLAGIMFDFSPSRLVSMRDAGIERVEIMGSGSNDDCPACTALHHRLYSIEEVPKLPPPDCTCVPWCRCIELANR